MRTPFYAAILCGTASGLHAPGAKGAAPPGVLLYVAAEPGHLHALRSENITSTLTNRPVLSVQFEKAVHHSAFQPSTGALAKREPLRTTAAATGDALLRSCSNPSSSLTFPYIAVPPPPICSAATPIRSATSPIRSASALPDGALLTTSAALAAAPAAASPTSLPTTSADLAVALAASSPSSRLTTSAGPAAAPTASSPLIASSKWGRLQQAGPRSPSVTTAASPSVTTATSAAEARSLSASAASMSITTAASPSAAAAVQPSATAEAVGARVRLTGLWRDTHLNGATGTITAPSSTLVRIGMHAVRLDDAALLPASWNATTHVRGQNLEVLVPTSSLVISVASGTYWYFLLGVLEARGWLGRHARSIFMGLIILSLSLYVLDGQPGPELTRRDYLVGAGTMNMIYLYYFYVNVRYLLAQASTGGLSHSAPSDSSHSVRSARPALLPPVVTAVSASSGGPGGAPDAHHTHVSLVTAPVLQQQPHHG